MTLEKPLHLLSCLPVALWIGGLATVPEEKLRLVLLLLPLVAWATVVLSCLLSFDRSFTSLLDYGLCPRNVPVHKPSEAAVVVVGASRGLGRDLVAHLVAKGCFVLATVRKPRDAEQLRSEFGSECLRPIFLELTDGASVHKACREIASFFPEDNTNPETASSTTETTEPENAADNSPVAAPTQRCLAAVVTVAGVTSMGPFEGIPFDRVEHLVTTNVLGTMRVIHGLLPVIRHHKARIVLTGAPDVPLARYAAKVACNGALLSFSRALRTDLMGLGVSVSILQPAATRGGMVREGPELIRKTHRSLPPSLRTVYPPGFRLLRQQQHGSDFGFSTDWALWAYEHAIASPSPKTRYATTPPGTALYFLSYLLPDRLLEWLAYYGPLGPGGSDDEDDDNDGNGQTQDTAASESKKTL